jgi:hypothetical protein
LKLVGKRPYCAGTKLTPEQAKTESKFACEFAPKIYGVKAASFEEVWNRYGMRIEKHGLGHYSKVVLMIARLDHSPIATVPHSPGSAAHSSQI